MLENHLSCLMAVAEVAFPRRKWRKGGFGADLSADGEAFQVWTAIIEMPCI